MTRTSSRPRGPGRVRRHRGRRVDRVFGAVSVDETVLPASEAVVREIVGKTPLESILVTQRGEVEETITRAWQDRLARAGLHLAVERVRIVDAHPPREVVPAYREVSSAVSNVERYRNEAEAYAAEQSLQAKAEAQSIRDQAATRANRVHARAEGRAPRFWSVSSLMPSIPIFPPSGCSGGRSAQPWRAAPSSCSTPESRGAAMSGWRTRRRSVRARSKRCHPPRLHPRT